MTLYATSGFMRCGTSMMMRSLEAGGLTAAYNPVRDEMNETHGDPYYKPNEGGFYELRREQYLSEDFPSAYEGMLVKSLWGGIIRLPHRDPTDPYRVVLMRRDPEEIQESVEGFFQIQGPKTPLRFQAPRVEAALNRTEAILHQRGDVRLHTFWYPEVLADPLTHFQRLADDGWPIDPERASGVVDPACYRFRKEEVTDGA